MRWEASPHRPQKRVHREERDGEVPENQQPEAGREARQQNQPGQRVEDSCSGLAASGCPAANQRFQ